jgi:2-hydroxy-3-oxopropionate reductase
VLERKAPDMIARRFRPGFTCELHHKDLGILMSVAREAGVVIPLASAVTQLMAALVAQGHGGLDNGALLQLVEQLSGRGRSTEEK